MDIAHYFDNPEELNKETLYDLRKLIAIYPFYQPARILLLKNLFLLHDATFDEELRRAAIYITDRRVLLILLRQHIVNYISKKHKKVFYNLQKVRNKQKYLPIEQYHLLIISSNKFPIFQKRKEKNTEGLRLLMQL